MAENLPLVARIMLEGGGDGGSGGPPVAPGMAKPNLGGQPKNDSTNLKKIADRASSTNKGIQSHISKTLGIQVGIASILKQSQVFTSYVGTIFQLMGALVDVILAPFLPVLIPAIRLIADMIPIAAKYAQNTFDYLRGKLTSLWEGLLDLPIIRDWVKKIPKATGDFFKRALVAVLMGVFFMKLFGVFNLLKVLIGAGTKSSVYWLRIIAQNTAMVGGGVGKMGGQFAKGAKASRLLGLQSLMRLTMMGTMLTTLGATTQRGNQSTSDTLKGGFAGIKRFLGVGTSATRLVPRQINASAKTNSKWWASLWKGIVKHQHSILLASMLISPLRILKGIGPMFKGLGLLVKFGGKALGIVFRTVGVILMGSIKLVGKILGGVGKLITASIKGVGRGVQFVRSQLGRLGGWIVKGTLDMVNSVGRLGASLAKMGLNLLTGMGKGLLSLGTMIVSGLASLATTLVNSITGLVKSIGGVVGKAVGGVVKGGAAAGKGIFGFAKSVGGAVLGKAANIGKVAVKGARFIPGIGVIAEAGYGGYKTFKSFQEHGLKAGMARGAFTLSAMGASLLDPTGVGSAAYGIGGHLILDKLEKSGKLGSRGVTEVTVNNNIHSEHMPPWQAEQERHQHSTNREISINAQAHFSRSALIP